MKSVRSQVLPESQQQDSYSANCSSMYPSHVSSGTPGKAVAVAAAATVEAEIFSGSPAYHYPVSSSWTPGPTGASPVSVATPHNYNPNYQGYYNNPPTQNYISPPPPMVLYPQLYSTVNQNQIHLHLHGDLNEDQVTIASGNLTISSSNRLEIGVMGEENEQRNDVWRPY